MSTEPERDIEKTLRAYAKRRREDAGEAPELSPATRRLLQGEVVRLRDKRPVGPITWQQRLWGSWPRIALNTSIVAVMVVVFDSIFFPARTQKNAKADRVDMLMARNELAKAKKSAVQQKEGRALESLNSPAPEAPSPISRNRLADSESDKATPPSGNANQSSTTLTAPASAAAPAPVTVIDSFYANTSLGIMDNSTSTVSLRFAREKESELASKASNRGAGGVILNSFQVERTGNRIRIIDSDGSVYEGFTGASSNVVDDVFATANKDMSAGKLETGIEVARAGIRPSPAQPSTTRDLAQNSAAKADSRSQIASPDVNYYFRVSGTNLSLKAPVIFNGNLKTAEISPAQTSATPGFAGGAIAASSFAEKPRTNASSSTNASSIIASPAIPRPASVQVEGRAVVGGTNQIQIKAFRVEP